MIRTIALLVCIVALLEGCGGGNGSEQMPPPPAATVQFTALVKQVMAAPADTAAPMEVGNLSIAFDDDENPQAFDDILAAAM